MSTQQLGQEGFRWFIGLVEDINDPLLLGRAKVRILNEHDEGVITDDLDWAHILTPTTSSSVEGVGETPSISVGSHVVGFFMDGNEKQMAMIIGTFPVIPDNDDNKHSISWLARGKNTIAKEAIGPEPESAYNAQYPFNKTITTRGGHVIELDDTPENERVHIYHKSGAYVEINSEGRVVIKSVDDSYDITGKNKTIFAKGDIDIVSEGNITLAAKKGIKMGAPGGVTITQGGLVVEGTIASKVGVSGTFTSPSGKTIQVVNGLVVNIS